MEWQVGAGAGEFPHSTPADPSGNALGPFAHGQTARVRNANGTGTGSVRTVTILAAVV